MFASPLPTYTTFGSLGATAILPVLLAHPVVPANGRWNSNDERTYSATFLNAQRRAGTLRAVTLASRVLPHMRTYRFDNKTFAAFEDDCAQHLSNPKRVIEALILHWLDAKPNERAAMAQMHRQRIGAGSPDEE